MKKHVPKKPYFALAIHVKAGKKEFMKSSANSHSQFIFIQFYCTHQTGPLKGQCMISKILSSPFLVLLLEQSIGTYFFIGISNFICHM